MSPLGWILIIILGLDAVTAAAYGVVCLLCRWRDRKNEKRETG